MVLWITFLNPSRKSSLSLSGISIVTLQPSIEAVNSSKMHHTRFKYSGPVLSQEYAKELYNY